MDLLTRERLGEPKPAWQAVNRWGDTAEQIEERRRALERYWRDPK